MAIKNAKVEKTKTLIKQGVVERAEIAKMLGIQTSSASTYISIARKELKEEGFIEKDTLLLLETVSPSTQAIEEQIAKESETISRNSIALAQKKHRLRPKSIASDYFTYNFDDGSISIVQNGSEVSGVFVLNKEELHEFIEDLKELIEYL